MLCSVCEALCHPWPTDIRWKWSTHAERLLLLVQVALMLTM